jgi:hypothetical protein
MSKNGIAMITTTPSYYDILSIGRGTSPDEIRQTSLHNYSGRESAVISLCNLMYHIRDQPVVLLFKRFKDFKI